MNVHSFEAKLETKGNSEPVQGFFAANVLYKLLTYLLTYCDNGKVSKKRRLLTLPMKSRD